MSGYELAKRFEASVGSTWSAGHSQIYPELNRLADEGFVDPGEPGPRGRKTYTITGDGLAAVRAWLARTEPDRTVRDEAALRTYFLWLMEPAAARAHVEDELTSAQETLDALRGTAALRRPATPAERSQRIALEAGLRWAQARADWAEWALARLDVADEVI
jgi:DNA-binding PadR family transcriptional regulator